jgi:DNA-binding NarL/FixJ family response regulator
LDANGRASGLSVNGTCRSSRRAHQRKDLALMGAAADAERIAGELRISVNTARGYIQNILEKLSAHSRLEAVVRATELGLLGA